MSDTMTHPAFEVALPAPVLNKSEREYQAFLQLLPELLKTHRGQYVAIHGGQFVDCDADDIALIKRVHAKVGYVPIHVGRVVEPQPVSRIPHYREIRPGDGK
jgi:hydrogenase maturation factor